MSLLIQACFCSLGLFHLSHSIIYHNSLSLEEDIMSYDLNSLPRKCEPLLSFHRSKKLPANTCAFSTSALSNLCVLWKLKGLFMYFLQRFARSPSLTLKYSCRKLNLTYLRKLILNKTFHYSGF